MTFAHPLMLLGLTAALIPLLVHLFDRRRPRPVSFPPIAFVLRSQRRTASRFKLKRLVLYALRTLILLALPLALARPEWSQRAAALALNRGPAATAVVLDASLSMRWSDGTSLFARGQERARAIFRSLSPEEPATFVLCGPDPKPPLPLSFERARLRREVDQAQPSYAGQILNPCLDLAARALEESPLPAKRVVVISDFTQNALRLESPLPQIKTQNGTWVRPEVVLEDVGKNSVLANRGITDLQIQPAAQLSPRAFQFTFNVRNHGPAEVKDVEAALRLGHQTVAKGFVDLPKGGATQKTLGHSFDQGGTVAGEVSLSPDGLAEDDHRAFVLPVPQEIRALVANGSPNSVRYRDEAFFVEAALNAPGSPVRPTLRDADAAFKEDFSAYQLVLLLNVPVPPPEVAERLRAFVKAGGGLFISVGDQVDPDAYDAAFADLLPRSLRVPKTAARPDEPDAERKAIRLTQVDEAHPLFQPFAGRSGEGLRGSLFYRYMLVESSGAKGSGEQVLATFQDGAPALLLSKLGRGQVLLFTSTVDRDWSDFAIRTSFLPFMHRACALLSGTLQERETASPRVGESVGLRPAAPVFKIRAPSGAESPVTPLEDGRVKVGPLMEPGVYQLLDAAGKPIPAESLAVVLDPAESDLTHLSEASLTSYFGQDSVRNATANEPSRKTPMWSWLIALAAVAFFSEGLLLRKS